jgi:hypothetical protein
VYRIEPAVDADSAKDILAPRRPWSTPAQIRVAGQPGADKQLPFLESVWLPAYEFTFAGDNLTSLVCVVDAMAGSARLHQSDTYRISRKAVPETFAPAVDEMEAVDIATRTVMRALLYRRRSSGLDVSAPSGLRVVWYPYWVYYFQRRNYIDIRALDGVTGGRVGHKLKLGILDAFRQRAAETAAF